MPKGFQSAASGASNSEIAIIQDYMQTLLRSGWIAEAHEILTQLVPLGYVIDEALNQRICEARRAPSAEQTKLAPHRPVGCLDNGIVLSSLHFSTHLTEAQKKAAFKSSVRKIDVETSTQCNRKCSYCSNSLHDRRSFNKYMPDAMFERLVTELSSIDYSGQLSFVGHNEPLMHADDIGQRLSFARPRLPNARIAVFSNGDYLDAEILKALEDGGVDDLNLTVHTAPGKTYDECAAMQRMFDTARKLGLKPSIEEFLKGIKVHVALAGSKMNVTIRAADMQTVGHNQGGGVPGAGLQVQGRTDPCTESLFGFIVGHTGNVHPCSLVVADIPQHAHCVMGNLGEASIFDIYTGAKFIDWRRQLLTEGPKCAPCSACPCNTKETPGNWSDMVHQAMELAAVADAGVRKLNAA